MGNEKAHKKTSDYLFESITEYDIDESKRYDMKLGGAKKLILSGYDGEKICVRLVSNILPTLQNDLKVKIDDIKKRIDVDINRKNGMTEASAKEAVHIFVQIPSSYIEKIELSASVESLELNSLECDKIELNVRTQNISLNGIIGTIEIDCNLDMNVVCHSLNGDIAINQMSATSKICIPDRTIFSAVAKGIGTSISFEKNGKKVNNFDTPDADNVIELNGIKSELIICTHSEE